MSLKNIFYELVSLRDRLRTALVATGVEADSSVSLNQLAGMLETQVSEGGGSAAFDLVKVTGHTETHEAYSAITQIVVSGLVEDQEMGIDFSGFNGTYLPTSDTAEETDPLKRIYKHSTANKWIKHYVWDPEETGEGTGYWLLVTNLSQGLWDADLSKSSNDQPLSTGTATWSNENYGASASVTLAVTTTNYPAETWSLTVQKASSYTDANYIRTYNADGQDIALTASDIPIVLGGLAVRDSTNEKLVLPISNSNKTRGAGILLLSDLVSPTPEIGEKWLKFYGDDSRIEWGKTDSGITGVWLNYASILSPIPAIPKGGDVTMAFWAKNLGFLVHIMSIGRDKWGEAFSLWISANGNLVLSLSGIEPCETSGSGLRESWHHYAATHHNGTCILYVDGVQRATGSGVVNIGDPTVYINGSFNSNGGGMTNQSSNSYFAGIKVYNACLTAAEIAALAAEFTPTA